MSQQTFSMAEVKKHHQPDDAWLVIDGDIYNVTKFWKMHPGGGQLLLSHAGTDATEAFFDMHKTEVLNKYKRLIVGRLETSKGLPRALDAYAPGTLSDVPYAEPAHLQGFKSPVQTEKHKRFRIAVRKWNDEQLRPIAARLGASGKTPSLKTFQQMGKDGMLAVQLAPSPELTALCKKLGLTCPGGIPWEEYDLFMEQIAHEEHARIGVPGVADGICAGYTIATPTLIYFGTEAMKTNILPEILLGNKRICLAITEPFAGSDVAAIKTTAIKTPDGKHYVVNGVKKWISGGLDSDYFVTAVRTGGKGMRGISLLLIERGPGLSTKLIKTSYATSAGTAYVTMENLLVPVENLIGQENKGFACIMKNFNHERWMIIVNVLGQCRLVLHDCILWANQRKVFGKKLLTQPVIQAKISEMAAQVEALSCFIDQITYQMQYMDYEEQSKKLAGPIALLKFYSTRVALLVSDHASQIFGGRAITKSGMGQNVERFARAVKYTAIYGGSEEIMQSLAAKQMMKRMPKAARL